MLTIIRPNSSITPSVEQEDWGGDDSGIYLTVNTFGCLVKLQPEAPSVEEIIENSPSTHRPPKQERKRNEGKCLWGDTFEE